MSLEIREPRGDELDEVAYITAYSFDGDRSPEALEGNPGTVGIRTYREGPWAVLTVSDTGRGIEESFRRHALFRPFRTTKPKGLGIGLFQCRAIVEAHSGRIEAESGNGKGTTFTVRLPILSLPLPPENS